MTDEEDEDEEESAPAVGSPRQVELGVGFEQVELDAGAKEVAADIGEQATSLEDIAKDYFVSFFFVYDDCASWRFLLYYRGWSLIFV